jgi:hypothetical protein
LIAVVEQVGIELSRVLDEVLKQPSSLVGTISAENDECNSPQVEPICTAMRAGELALIYVNTIV